jgi:hypothetical protein
MTTSKIFHIKLVDTSAPGFAEMELQGFQGVKAPFTDQTQSESIQAALEQELKSTTALDGVFVALAFKGGQMDEQGIVWPSPVEDEYVMGTVRWWLKSDEEVVFSFQPRIDQEINPAAANLDAELAKVEGHTQEAIDSLTRRVNGIKTFRTILRTRNPRRMLDLLIQPSEDPEDRAAMQTMISLGLVCVVPEGEGVEGMVSISPAALDVIEITNHLARRSPADAAEEMMAGTDEIELDFA